MWIIVNSYNINVSDGLENEALYQQIWPLKYDFGFSLLWCSVMWVMVANSTFDPCKKLENVT